MDFRFTVPIVIHLLLQEQIMPVQLGAHPPEPMQLGFVEHGCVSKMNQTIRLLSVNDIGDREAVVATRVCRRIIIGEQSGATTDYDVADAASGGNVIRKLAGSPYVFEKPFGSNMKLPGLFSIGDIAGYVNTASGTVNFYVIEE